MEFRHFNSFEEAVEFMDKATRAANATLAEEQRSLTYGSYWVRFMPAEQLMIFGKVMTLAEIEDGERKAGSDEDELAYTMENVKANHERGYLFGTAYSIMEPEGELGDTHRANMWPITEEQFEKAKAGRWIPDQIDGWDTWLVMTYEAFRAHVLSIASGHFSG